MQESVRFSWLPRHVLCVYVLCLQSLYVGDSVQGNKGGVVVRLRLLDTTICFVCSHLAAHTEDVEGRNQVGFSVTFSFVFAMYASHFSK